MNDLQLSLLALGGAMVVGVYAHGKWQEIRQRKIAARMLSGAAGDPLMQGATESSRPSSSERREPTLGGDSVLLDGSALRDSQAGTLKSGTQCARTAQQEMPRPADEPGLVLVSPEADFLVAFALLEPVSGEELETIAGDSLHGIRKRVAWVGYDEYVGTWDKVRPQGHYRLLRIGLQLADRNGPLSGSLLDQFKKAMEKVGDTLTAVPQFPNSRDAVVRAVNLDRICAEVDIQLSVHIAPRHGHFVPDVVRDAALGIGFQLDHEGAVSYPDAAGQRLFALQLPDARTADGLPAPTICLLLDVPCVERGEFAFDRMMAVAQELADGLDGIVVDEQRRPITERFVAPVRQQITQLQARMLAQGVPAGSPLALRLFT